MKHFFAVLLLAFALHACESGEDKTAQHAQSPPNTDNSSPATANNANFSQEMRVDTVHLNDTLVQVDTIYHVDTILLSGSATPFIVATKANVLYKGLLNPVEIIVPSRGSDSYTVSTTNGSIKKTTENGYTLAVKSGTSAKLTVTDKQGGKVLGEKEFRIKNIPNPKPYFAGKSYENNRVQKRDLTAAQGVVARMENFDFDLKFTVSSFKLSVSIGGSFIEKSAQSNRLTGEMRTMLKKAKPGTVVAVHDIQAKGPDGTIRKLGALYFKVT